MSIQELKAAYSELPEHEQILFASLVAAEQMAKQPDFVAGIGRQHEAMDKGKKWDHNDVMALHGELEKLGL